MANERQLTLHSPGLSGEQALMVRRIEGREGLSQLFHYDVTLYARSENVDFSQVLGHEMCVGLELPGGKERFFHGYVASFADVASAGEYTVYRAELRPHFWRLTRATNSRIYQGETVPHIVEGILKHYGLDIEPHYGGGNRGDYLPWEYCVQYRETDFAFISRLLEYEGIHYFFRHEKQRHVMVLSDGNVHHEPVAGYDKVEYTRAPNQPNRRQECVWEWRVASSVLPDKVSATDFDFREPAKALAAGSGSEVKRQHGKVSEYEVYDHLETVVQQDGYSPNMTADYARIRSEELHVRFAVASAHTDARGLCAGAVLKLDQGPTSTQKKEYVILRTELSAEMDAYGTTASGSGAVVYRCWFEAFDKTHPYRPPRITPKPIIPGPQSAIVAGQGGPIVTDRWGRVYVKFHWARAPETNERELSCWLRVSQNSAGNQWGSMFVPHVGQEVLVGFLEGDPDRPIVIGRVYNGANPPPLTLPAEAHNSIIRDVSGNQIIMDPTKGKEKITITSPKNHSAVQLGNEGIRLFSRKRGGTYTWDTESYAFGHKISYTKGWSWSVDRGFWASVKAGAGVAVTVGADYKFSLGPRWEVKVGTVITTQFERSVSIGKSFELKTTAGAYRRMSGSDAILDSKKAVYIAGKNDNAMMTAAEKDLTLAFDDSDSNRQAKMEEAEKAIIARTKVVLGIATSAAMVGAAWYQHDVADMGPVHQKTGDESTEELETDYRRISSLSASDALPFVSAFMGVKFGKPDEPVPPVHKGPSSQIKLSKDTIAVFVGDAKKTTFSLKKASGFEFKSDKSIVTSSDQGIKLEGKQGILMKANTVNVDAAFKHRYFEILP